MTHEEFHEVPYNEWSSCQVYGHVYTDVEDENGKPTGERTCSDCGDTYKDE